jgi:hypothetical protein
MIGGLSCERTAPTGSRRATPRQQVAPGGAPSMSERPAQLPVEAYAHGRAHGERGDTPDSWQRTAPSW